MSVALSREQYEAMNKAIINWKEAQRILKRMEEISRSLIFGTLPDTRRRKPLTKRVMGVN